MSVRMDVPPHLLLALVDVVAVLDCDPSSAQEPHWPGGPSAVPPYSQDSPPQDGMTGIIWPLLDVVHGDLQEVFELCTARKSHVRELRLSLHSGSLSEGALRQQFMDVLCTSSPVTLELEVDEDDCAGLAYVLVSSQS